MGNGLLDFDGHGNFSPDGKWMATDTYPTDNTWRNQKIYFLNMETQAAVCLGEGKFIEPEEFSGIAPATDSHAYRCDLHNRWSKKGNILGFNATFTGSRQAYIIKVSSVKLTMI